MTLVGNQDKPPAIKSSCEFATDENGGNSTVEEPKSLANNREVENNGTAVKIFP